MNHHAQTELDAIASYFEKFHKPLDENTRKFIGSCINVAVGKALLDHMRTERQIIQEMRGEVA